MVRCGETDEIETPAGRIAYGPVAVDDIAIPFDADFLNGGPHPLALGLMMRSVVGISERVTLHVLIIDPSLSEYRHMVD